MAHRRSLLDDTASPLRLSIAWRPRFTIILYQGI